MWLSDRRRREREGPEGAQVGRVTLPGDPAGVYLGGERRGAPVFAPGGYAWRPALDQQVLVIKTGAEGELPCVAGARCPEVALAPGEVCIRAWDGMASVLLRSNGVIELSGFVRVNGEQVGPSPEAKGD